MLQDLKNPEVHARDSSSNSSMHPLIQNAHVLSIELPVHCSSAAIKDLKSLISSPKSAPKGWLPAIYLGRYLCYLHLNQQGF